MRQPMWILTVVFAGMAGAQVLEWVDLDGEIKTAGLKDVSESYHPFVPPSDYFK